MADIRRAADGVVTGRGGRIGGEHSTNSAISALMNSRRVIRSSYQNKA
jgi:hypothetical protein